MAQSNLRVEQLSPGEWSALSRRFSDYSYHQNLEYAQRSANAIGASAEFVRIYNDDVTIGAAAVRLKTLPLLDIGIAYINHGPLVRSGARDTGPDDLVQACVNALVEEYAQRRNFMLRLVLPIRSMQAFVRHPWGHYIDANGLRRGRRRYRTILIDLDTNEAELRARLHQKWRNCLNRAESQEMNIISGTGADFFARFLPLFDALREKKGFSVDLDPRFFGAFQDDLPEDEKLIVHLAERDGRIVAGHIGSFVGDTAVYLFGAASDEGNRVNASYRLQWEVMRHARAIGQSWYDLGGIDPEGNAGVFRFKKRMGGKEATAAGPFEFAPPFRRGFLLGAERLYNLWKYRI